ncbi:hypothetical protein [Anaeroselena agilis]|uniref:Uncharacterized protein n=1 Tax=Anaeroselena agilis TaxID=3063788 RepID=A0ABU3P0E9_9FIRM|nr:hypothetical protein [Selenomonadales bacterium 4137-cl]
MASSSKSNRCDSSSGKSRSAASSDFSVEICPSSSSKKSKEKSK